VKNIESIEYIIKYNETITSHKEKEFILGILSSSDNLLLLLLKSFFTFITWTMQKIIIKICNKFNKAKKIKK
jgi:hypothetical protein